MNPMIESFEKKLIFFDDQIMYAFRLINRYQDEQYWQHDQASNVSIDHPTQMLLMNNLEIGNTFDSFLEKRFF